MASIPKRQSAFIPVNTGNTPSFSSPAYHSYEKESLMRFNSAGRCYPGTSGFEWEAAEAARLARSAVPADRSLLHSTHNLRRHYLYSPCQEAEQQQLRLKGPLHSSMSVPNRIKVHRMRPSHEFV